MTSRWTKLKHSSVDYPSLDILPNRLRGLSRGQHADVAECIHFDQSKSFLLFSFSKTTSGEPNKNRLDLYFWNKDYIPSPSPKKNFKVETKVTKLRKLKENILKYVNVSQKCLYLNDIDAQQMWNIKSKNYGDSTDHYKSRISVSFSGLNGEK